jgi:hypothetical protein
MNRTNPSSISSQIHERVVKLGLEPVFCLGDVIFYNTKNFFKKHNFGRDVKRFVNKNDWCIYNNKYHLNARGIITLGFAKKHAQVQEMVWDTLQLPASNANLEPNQYFPEEEEEIEIKKESAASPSTPSSKLEPTVFSLPPISTRDTAVIGTFESPRTAPPPQDNKVPRDFSNNHALNTYTTNGNNTDRTNTPTMASNGNALPVSRLKRPLSTQQFQFHNYTQASTPLQNPTHQLPPRQLNYQLPPPISEPNHRAYRVSSDMSIYVPQVSVSHAQHPGFNEQSNFPPENSNYYRLEQHREQPQPPQLRAQNNNNSVPQDNRIREDTRETVVQENPRQQSQVPQPASEDGRHFPFSTNSFGMLNRDPPQEVPSLFYNTGSRPSSGFLDRQNGFGSRNSSGYLSDRMGSRHSSGYLSDRSYESDRELERQSGFFMVMSDDIVSQNLEYMYYHGNGSFDFPDFLPVSPNLNNFGHPPDLPSVADEPPRKKL